MPLSDAQCRAAKPKPKPYKLSDSEGLYLQVMPSGAKYWRLKYRFQEKEKKLALGVYPKVSLLEARRGKDQSKIDLKNGFDPALIKIAKTHTAAIVNSQTYKLLAEEWWAKNVDAWNPRYAQTVRHRLEKYTYDMLGDFPIQDITPALILACLRKIDGSAPYMARRVKRLICSVFKYAIATSRATSDPTYGLNEALKKYKKGHFASIEVDEFSSLVLAILNHKSRLYRQTYLAIWLMLLTFVRTKELIEAEWTEFDFEQARWIIPAARMKKEKPHIVPLSRQAITILLELKEMNGAKPVVFPGYIRKNRTMSNGTILVALKRMKYDKRMTGHGFRSLAMGILKEKLGFSHEIADRQLAHVRHNGNDRAYDRAEFLAERTMMMQRYADYIDKVKAKEMLKSL